MQNRYFGDVGDFGKYGLLRRICGVGAEDASEVFSLGVVWYLVGDERHNEDGRHTTYLDKPEEYRDCDPELFDGLKSLLDGPGPRAVTMIERSGLELLPHGTKYVSEPLTRERRSEWLSRAIEEVRDCDVVFLDPDRGFQPPSVKAGHQNAVQYVLWKEAERFAESHEQQTLVFYHHLNRTKPWRDQIDEKIQEIGSRVAGGEAAIPVLFKRGTGRVFFVVPSEEHRDLVTSRVLGMVKDAHWSRHARIAGAGKRVLVGGTFSEKHVDPVTARASAKAGADQRRKRMMSVTEKATVRVGAWNTEWAKADSPRGKRIRPLLGAPDCDILCVTEVGDADILPKGGNIIDAGTDWGYEIPKASPGRRKVLLWSKRPWTPVFDPLQAELPRGRLVAGTTETPIGKITVVGVCIPWRDAHVTTGMANRRPWEDHLAWLSGFERLSYAHSAWRTVVLGDFNQRTPKGNVAPLRVHDALKRPFRFLTCCTEGAFVSDPEPPALALPDLWRAELQGPSDGAPGALIDHIAHSEDMTVHQAARRGKGVRRVGIFPQQDLKGANLSDHNGVWIDLKA